MDWVSNDEQLLMIDANVVVNVDGVTLSITDVETDKGMARTVMMLIHEAGDDDDAVTHTFMLSSHALYALFQAMSTNVHEFIEMGWIPNPEQR